MGKGKPRPPRTQAEYKAQVLTRFTTLINGQLAVVTVFKPVGRGVEGDTRPCGFPTISGPPEGF